MKTLLCSLSLFFCLLGCSQREGNNTANGPLSRQSIQKIDVHAHFRYARPYLPEFFERWNMRAVLVDVAKEDSAGGIDRSWNQYTTLAAAHPDLFVLCSSLIGVGIDEPGFAQKNIDRLTAEIAAGARMVKVWKNFGMVTRDTAGNFIQIDDPRLQPIWDFLQEKDIPVMAHIAEPLQAWRPLDDPNNPHFRYYSEHPEYHAYQHPEIPAYETIIAARDRWLERNPGLRVLCAHLGSMSHDAGMVAERLDKYPNIMAEPAARFGDLAGQNSDSVRAFFIKYQGRLMFGTDFGTSTSAEGWQAERLEAERENLDASYDLLWRYLSSTDSLVIRQQKTKGLGLPEEVLTKVYFQNAADFLGIK